MAAIALLESGGNPSASNPSGATGLWQIEFPLHKDLTPDGTRQSLYDPTVNAKAAIAILNGGAGLCSGWGTQQGGDAIGIAVCNAGSKPWNASQLSAGGFGGYLGKGSNVPSPAGITGGYSGPAINPSAGWCNSRNGGTAWSFGGVAGIGSVSISWCEVKAGIAAALIVGGVAIAGLGIVLVVSSAAKESGAGRAALSIARKLPVG